MAREKKRLWLFNYDFEFVLSGREPVDALAKGPWWLLNRSDLWLAPLLEKNDAIYMVEPPDATCLDSVSSLLGFTPQIITAKPKRETNSTLANATSALGDQLTDYELAYWGDLAQLEIAKEVNSKVSSARWRKDLLPASWDIETELFPTANFTKKAFNAACAAFGSDHFVKDPYGVSGQNLILNPDYRDASTVRNWVKHCDYLLLEQKISFQKELSVHFDFSPAGWGYVGKTELKSTAKGVYLGSLVTQDQDFTELKELEPLLNQISSLGYLGPLGLDLLLDEQQNHRLLEINGRFSMGRLAIEWSKKSKLGGDHFLLRLAVTEPLELTKIEFGEGINPLNCSYHKRGWLNLLVTGATKAEISRKLTQFQRKNKLSDIAPSL